MKFRRYHLLRPNKSSSRPESHLFVDVESRLVPISETETEHRLWFGWTCFWRRRTDRDTDTIEYERFTTVPEFWAIVERRIRKGHSLYLVSHNVNYDFGVLDVFENLETRGYELGSIYLSSMTAILTWRASKRKLIILDNGNFFQGALATLGEAVGYPKMDVDPLTATEKEADPYCKRDTEILLKAWQAYYRFLDTHNLGHWGRTLPAQAFNAYRHRFMPYTIHIHADDRVLELERKAYHGGRTSIFYKGHLTAGPYYYLDVNSMYPYVMREHLYPRTMHKLRSVANLETLATALRKYLCIADVTVNTPERAYQVKHHGHAVHPVGQFRVTLTTPELSYALAHDHIVAVHHLVRYEGVPLFRKYVDFFYQLKRDYKADGNAAYYHMVKLFLNSLYGKFGQRSRQMVRIEDPDPDLAKCTNQVNAGTGAVTHLYRFGSTLWYQEDTGEAYNSAPAIAAHVTAHARMYLWKLITTAGEKHVYYCDTDSLLVDQTGYARLQNYLDMSRLGALKVENSSSTCTLRAPKCYTLGKVTRRKGIPGKAKKRGEATWDFESFPSFRQQAHWDKGVPFHTKHSSRSLSYHIFDGDESPEGWITPFDAQNLDNAQRLDPQTLSEIVKLQAQVKGMQETVPLTPTTVFSLWDYRKGDWKKARDSFGRIMPLEYSKWDSKATELGFSNLSALKGAVTQTLDTWENVNTLRSRIHTLTVSLPEPKTQDPLPF